MVRSNKWIKKLRLKSISTYGIGLWRLVGKGAAFFQKNCRETYCKIIFGSAEILQYQLFKAIAFIIGEVLTKPPLQSYC